MVMKVSPLLHLLRLTSRMSSFSASAAPLANPKHVLVPIANGSESLETVGITNLLSRFGAQVTVASVHLTDVAPLTDPLVVRLTRGTTVLADAVLPDVSSNRFDMIILPGGLAGCETFASSEALKLLLSEHRSRRCWLGAICAAPALVLAPLGHLSGSPLASCYPSPPLVASLLAGGVDKYLDPWSSSPSSSSSSTPVPSDTFDGVHVDFDRLIVTAPGAGRTVSFALKCGEMLFGEQKARDVAREIVAKFPEKGT